MYKLKFTSYSIIYSQLSRIWRRFHQRSTLYQPNSYLFKFKLLYAALTKRVHMFTPVKNSPVKIFQLILLYSLTHFFIIHDCTECQSNKHFAIKPDKNSPPLPFYKNATHFNYRISMDTKGLISFYSQNTSIFCKHWRFLPFCCYNPASYSSSKYGLQTLLNHWNNKFGPPQYLVSDRGTEYINQDMTHLCSLSKI